MNRRLRKLTWAIVAVLTLATIRLGLSLISYARLRKILSSPDQGDQPPKDLVDRCAWALTRGSRVVPGASCLTQALAGQWLLHRLGYASKVVIGVRPVAGGSLAAHAWLVASGRTVVGGDAEDLSRFQKLTELGASS